MVATTENYNEQPLSKAIKTNPILKFITKKASLYLDWNKGKDAIIVIEKVIKLYPNEGKHDITKTGQGKLEDAIAIMAKLLT